jgi:hypothetical protein
LTSKFAYAILHTMSIERACELILGEEIARMIFCQQGLPWAILAASAMATKDHDIMALSTLACCLEKQKRNIDRAILR